MNRHGLRGDQFARIEKLLPGRPGHVGRDSEFGNRLFVEAVIWKFRTGVPWRDMPVRFGAWKNIHTRFSRWAVKGIWESLFKAVADDPVIGAKVRAEVVWRWVVVAANRKLRGGDSRIGDCLNLWGNAAAAGHRRAFACRAEELGVGAFGRARGISPNDRGATRRDRAAERRPWAAGHQGQRQAADPAERHGKGERDAAGGPVWRAPAARPHAYKADHP